MSDRPELLLGFYGDDFTGSTDAMEALTRAGLRTVLFLQPPTTETLFRYNNLQAIGIAGCTRALPPSEMANELRPAFTALRDLQLPIVHYKICSTFDSSPQIGSIGQAIDIGAEVFSSSCVPLLAGVPVLGRYCVFGNLFARSGTDTEPYRLDRHPTMSRHPITPMNESDIRLHLGQQTARRIELLDVLSLSHPEKAVADFLNRVKQGAQIILIDLLTPEQEPVVGRVLSDCAQRGTTLFVVGSSGVEYTLTSYWRTKALLPEKPHFDSDSAEKAVIMSGSCSPVTERQIAWACAQGAAEIRLDTAELVTSSGAHRQVESAVSQAVQCLDSGRTVICHCARGPSDPRVHETRQRLMSMGYDARQQSARVLGDALGTILLAILQRKFVGRAVVAGGDTSYFTAKRLGIEALEMIAPVAPGCPLCRAYAADKAVDGLKICFKGGQVGRDDFVSSVLNPQTADG